MRVGGSVGNSVNIRDFSIKCGRCGQYQTLCGFARRSDLNVYTYECENEVCEADATRTLVEVARELDEFARRDPDHRSAEDSARELRTADPKEGR